MRIIAGKYRGLLLKGPKHKGLRPTADRVREALFNIIGARIIEADFLDLFAGTGAIGIEALSRGARWVVFTDQSLNSIKLLQENLKIVAADTQWIILHSPAESSLMRLAKDSLKFDLIFLDPPFEAVAQLLPQIITAIRDYRLLKENGWLIVEHPRKTEISALGFTRRLIRSYGDIGLSIFELSSNAPSDKES
ncbi:MAG: 16S rRNA (guanine(966)-N(2))-methyltransferase RsmD [Firmicutes bacterium]|nr:16S rRNA (guanine(966)-N(2))-methyltransferase RsmD [Bacillota bacterium]